MTCLLLSYSCRQAALRIQAHVWSYKTPCFIQDWQGWLPEVYVEPIWRKEEIRGDHEKWEFHTPDPTPCLQGLQDCLRLCACSGRGDLEGSPAT